MLPYPSLTEGSKGRRVVDLQQCLLDQGFDVGPVDGVFGPSTAAALKQFQASKGLQADGVVGPNTLAALKMPTVTSNVTADLITPMFPGTPLINIQFHLPFVLKALLDAALADKTMILTALGTTRAEVACFQPIEEGVSQFNTTPGGPHPFDKYDFRADLGNQGPPDGERFKGRGFIQLTGRGNYAFHGNAIGLGTQLVQNPDFACDPDIATRLMASFLGSKAASIRQALQAGDLARARKLVNGGSHGLADFADAFQRGQGLIPHDVQVQIV